MSSMPPAAEPSPQMFNGMADAGASEGQFQKAKMALADILELYLKRHESTLRHRDLSVSREVTGRWQKTVTLMARMLGAKAGLVRRAVGNELEVLVASEMEGNPWRAGEREPRPVGNGYCERVLNDGRELMVPDAALDESWRDGPEVRRGMISYLGVPVRWPDGTVFGTLCVMDSQPRVYPEVHREMMGQFRDLMEANLERLYLEAGGQDARAQLARLTDNLPHGAVYRTTETPEGEITYPYASAGFLDLVGVPGSEIMRNPSALRETIHEEDLPLMREAELHSKATGDVFDCQFRCKHRSTGRVKWLHCRSAPSPGPGGSITWDGVVVDVTAQKLEEERGRQLRLAYENLQRLEKLARIGSWTWRVGGDRFTWSDMIYEMNGWDPATPAPDFEGLRQVCTAETFERLGVAVAKCLEDGQPYSVECESVRLNGEHFFTHVRGEAVRDESGEIVMLVGTLQDMTERREAEKGVRAKEERLALALRAGGLGIWELDYVRGEYLWDARVHEIYGQGPPHFRSHVSPGEYGGKREDYLTLVHPDDVPIIRHLTQQVDAGALSIEGEFRIPGANGEWRHIRALGNVSRDANGAPLRTVGVKWDVTEERRAADALRKAKEYAEAAEAAKGEFLAMMSHEIRTPMNTVLGVAQLMLKTELSPRQKNYLDKIDISARALVGLINDVLDFSKIEVGKLDLEEAEFTMSSLVESVFGVTALKAEDKGLDLGFHVARDVPERLVGDSLRLGQVLINLVNNAVKFTERGSVQVSVVRETGAESPSAVTLRFGVRDTGIGMNAAQIDGLFQAFCQGDAYTTRKYGGTGLGLAICKRLVELMGGRIWAEGSPDEGSLFQFTIQARLATAVPTLPPRSLSAPREQLAGRVLVVDDNAFNREVVTEFLVGMGLEVDSAVHGLDALNQLNRRDYDAVLMDAQMPFMAGLTAVREIRQHPKWASLPVIALTAHARATDRAESLAAGMTAHLSKPVDEALLYQTLREFLPAIGISPDVQSATDESLLPEKLPGIDLKIALTRMGGGHGRVLRHLRAFQHDFTPMDARLEAGLAERNLMVLADLAHVIHSAAAYLGAEELSTAATQLEEPARHGETDVLAKRVTAVREKLQVVLRGLQQGLSEGTARPISARRSVPVTALLSLVARAEPLVACGDYAALDLLEQIMQRLAGTRFASISEEACHHFEETQFSAASAALQQLREQVQPLEGNAAES